ncbi:unnamed protein product [Adineta ricciae]|uniref:Uncharacterized protein n=1 Tax=Adineta ricciae TaxID=249248 RepID=A0A813PZ75_ADIRI|nr:unnamed protein product [Adineta ricciae]CAF0758038.1 unnamed protein product [Adineta ricciae]
MGSTFSTKMNANEKCSDCSPMSAEERYRARQTAKVIYPPLSSIPDERPKRSLRPDGRELYESVRMDPELNQKQSNNSHEEHPMQSSFNNHYKQYEDGTFTVLSQCSTHHDHVFRL